MQIFVVVVVSLNLKFYTRDDITPVNIRQNRKKSPFCCCWFFVRSMLLLHSVVYLFFSFGFKLIWTNCDITANIKWAFPHRPPHYIYTYYLRQNHHSKRIKWLYILFIATKVYARLSSATTLFTINILYIDVNVLFVSF